MSSASVLTAYEGLVYTVFQQLRQIGPQGLVIAFSSSNRGEGVTRTVRGLLDGLGQDQGARTLSVDSRKLRSLDRAAGEMGSLCRPSPGLRNENLFELDMPSPESPGNSEAKCWESSWEYRRDVVHALRQAFDYVLIDCAAMREANDLLSLAPFMDGIILIVEAGRTRKEQILHAEKAIEFAHGKLLGHILNKRSYVVPDWLYRRL